MEKDFSRWNLLYADRLDKIRDVFLIVAENEGISKENLFNLIRREIYHPKLYRDYKSDRYNQSISLKKFSLLQRKHGISYTWKDRTLVEYIRATEFLRLIEEKNRCYYIGRSFEREKDVLKQENNKNERKFTSLEEKAILPFLFANKKIKEFLSWFMPSQRPPNSYKDFIEKSHSISLVDDPSIRKPEDMKGPNKYFSNGVWHIIPKQKIRVTWTYRNWSESINLLDEIKVDRNIVKVQNDNWKCFPIKRTKNDFNCKSFIRLLIREFGLKETNIKLLVPYVIFRLCSNYFISIEDVKELIIQSSREFGDKFYLEQVSAVFFDRKYSRTYIENGGFYRGYIAIKSTLIKEVKHG